MPSGGPAISTGGAAAAEPFPALATGVELLGEYQGSGYRQAPYLVRAGRLTLEVSPLLFQVCAALDARRSPDEVAEIVSRECGRPVTAADIAYLIEHKLRPLGVIAGSREAELTHRPPARNAGFSFRAPMLPRDAVGRAARILGVLFRPSLVYAVLVVFAVMDLWLWRTQDIGRRNAELLRHPALLLLVAGLTLAAGVFHEFGHAAACARGGAEPGAIGVGIYLVWPVFFNDLDDSYRLDRAGRLRADIGGIYFNLIGVMVLGAAYAASGFGPLLVSVGVQHLVVLQQFLPFLRLDGYYLLSDLAGVPDLFARIGPVIASLVPGRPVSPVVADLKPGARALVTAWVLVAVPLLVALLLLFVIRLPTLAAAIWAAAGLRARSLDAAWAARAGGAAALDALQLVLLLVAPAGVVATVGQLARAGIARARR